jgi:ABC-2 type transport system ATP-binding protein
VITAETADPTRTLHELTGWALRRGLVLAGLAVDQPSLEDIYLRLTGQAGPGRISEWSTR